MAHGLSFAPLPVYRLRRRDAGGLKASHVGSLSSLVADIAALGKPRVASAKA
jgi:hypothetical protein